MKILLSIFILLSFHVRAQDVSEINKTLNLSDTLTYKKEIRIYKKYQTAHNSEFFRMYEDENNKWKVEIFYWSEKLKTVTKIEVIEFPKETSGTLKPKDANLIWLNLLVANIEYLPSMASIKYKLETPYIDLENGESIIVKKKVLVLDGENYHVFVRNSKNKNHFIFDNPERYLKSFPKVDELQSYNKLLSIIKKEFNLWTE